MVSSFTQVSPIHVGLKDAHPYVRRTAVMGVLKVYNLDKAAVRNAGNVWDGLLGLQLVKT